MHLKVILQSMIITGLKLLRMYWVMKCKTGRVLCILMTINVFFLSAIII